MHFFSKIFGHVKKKQYLCTRFRERKHAGCSSARLECLLWEQEVMSSNLAIPTNLRKTYGFVSLFFCVPWWCQESPSGNRVVCEEMSEE